MDGGALIPRRALSPLIATTVTEITPSITSFSPICRVKTNMAAPPCQDEEVPRGFLPHHGRGDCLPKTLRALVGPARSGHPGGLAVMERRAFLAHEFGKGVCGPGRHLGAREDEKERPAPHA